MKKIFKQIFFVSLILFPLHTLISFELWKGSLHQSEIAFNNQKIYYETFLRERSHTNPFISSLKHSYNFEESFAKEQKFYLMQEKGAFNLSKDLDENWGIYAEAKSQKKYRVSTYNFMSGIKYSW